MSLLKEMIKKTCYGFSFGIGVGSSIHILPNNKPSIWPDSAIAKYFNKESK